MTSSLKNPLRETPAPPVKCGPMFMGIDNSYEKAILILTNLLYHDQYYFTLNLYQLTWLNTTLLTAAILLPDATVRVHFDVLYDTLFY